MNKEKVKNRIKNKTEGIVNCFSNNIGEAWVGGNIALIL